ncbi:uncharacterized protein LOC127783127 [Oryza glaberrima]|uniref:uncharacterized protein LOC127783127 n=1 Tax=Oryza glaberrima TaxID=4538 RepID=UPI00224C0CFE|nr:uncharacterized protein LOC127783127 [Oryza glaberrima]
MIKLNKRTCIIEAKDQPMDFPKYTFDLVSFDKLHDFTSKTDRFLDVIGKIIAVSNAAMISTSSSDYRMRRIVKLQDLSGKTIDLSLSGKRAVEFDGETILEVGQNNHIIAIFVGTSMKILKGTYEFLSGTTACRWYINENDIPEIKMFQKCLPPHADPIQKLYLQSDEDMQRSIEHKTLAELKEIDPFVDKDEKYQCTATIIGIQERKTWCYQACKLCNCKMIWDGSILKCKKENCPCRQYEYKYKIPFIANDGTASLELVLFEKKGTELIGRTAETMKRQYDINQTPPEIKAWIGHKFTFIVKVLPNITINADEPSFEVLTIKERFGRLLVPPPSELPVAVALSSGLLNLAASRPPNPMSSCCGGGAPWAEDEEHELTSPQASGGSGGGSRPALRYLRPIDTVLGGHGFIQLPPLESPSAATALSSTPSTGCDQLCFDAAATADASAADSLAYYSAAAFPAFALIVGRDRRVQRG